MRNILFEYLEFLLPIHNCVTIPDLGGFIVNISPSDISGGIIDRPKHTIVFNPELNHDDGIIISYISKNENISYNVAHKKVKDCVKDLFIQLKTGKPVICGNIGVLASDNTGSISFSVKKENPLPFLYGLEPIRVKPLNDITRDIRAQKRNTIIRYSLSGIASAVVAVFLFALPGANIENNRINSQKAGFISSITTTQPVSLAEKSDSFEKTEEKTSQEENVLPVNNNSKEKQNTRSYYIIVGGEENKKRAEDLLTKIRDTEFPNAAILKSADRYRIYISSFKDKKQAESFLDSFRESNPQYKTAWLYSK